MRRGFSRPLAPGWLRRRSEGKGARDESSRLILSFRAPSLRSLTPSRDPAAGSQDTRHPPPASPILRLLYQTPRGLRRRGDGRGSEPMRNSLSRPPSNGTRLTEGRGGTRKAGGGGLGQARGAARLRGFSASHRAGAPRGEPAPGLPGKAPPPPPPPLAKVLDVTGPWGPSPAQTPAAAAAAALSAWSPWKKWKKS